MGITKITSKNICTVYLIENPIPQTPTDHDPRRLQAKYTTNSKGLPSSLHRRLMGSLDDGVSSSVSSLPSNMEKFLCDRLLDPTEPISERFRALFSLRNLKGPGPRNALIQGPYSSLSFSLLKLPSKDFLVCFSKL